MQNKSDLLDTDLLSIRTTMQNPPGVCEAAPTARAVVICFASFIGSSSGLEFEHQREVSSVTRIAIGPSCDVLSPGGERCGLILFR